MTIAQLEHKLSQNPSSPIFARLADEYLTTGKPAEARALCASGLQLFPSYATAYIVLARCCEAEGDYESALASVAAAQKLLPFAPCLDDLQVDLMSKSGAPAGEEGSAPPETARQADGPAESLVVEAPVAPNEEVEPLVAEAAGEPDEHRENNASAAFPDSPAAEIAAPEETPAGDELLGLTTLEDELRKSLEAQLNPARTGEPLPDVPAAFSDTGEEITPDAVALPEEMTADEIEKPEAEVAETPDEAPLTLGEAGHGPFKDVAEPIGTPSDTVEEAGPAADEGGRPAEMEQFFNERISELQVESAPEIEAPEIEAPDIEAPEAEATEETAEPSPAGTTVEASAGTTVEASAGATVETSEESTIAESPVKETPAVGRTTPVAEEKPQYVPPPPVPEEEPADETTSLGVDGRIVSRTLAEIYVMQGAFAEAILTYQLLKLEKPELRAECEARIRELEPKLQEKSSL